MILYLDIEYDHRNKRIKEIGLVREDQCYKGRDQSRIKNFAEGAKWVCGHNLVAHDLEVLKKAGYGNLLDQIPAIDTLLLSPLLRPDLDRHKLAKDYLLNDLSKSDPVYDAELARDLLFDLGDLWKRLPQNIREGFTAILSHQKGFQGFFEWLDWEDGMVENVVNEPASLRSSFWGYSTDICANVDLESLRQTHAVELAYVLALLKTDDPKINTPSWMLANFPNIQQVFDQLRSTDCGDPDCTYCSSKLDPIEALNEFFGYPGFRAFEGDEGIPLQERVVRSALKDESLLAIFPTGGGKSLTFQLPALMRGKAKGALTVVISPLVSLMKDQVDVLFNRFHRNDAVALNGMLSPPERQEVIERIEDGTASLLYISPESLRSSTVLRLLTRRIIDRFVIDEAHCFSAWGQDFRVDYEFIGPYIKMLQNRKMDKRKIPVSCFTATARPEVVTDIKAYFREELGIELKEFITRQSRRNLEYQVVSVKNKEEKFEHLVEILQENKGPAIVYVSLTKTTEALAEKLKGFQIKAGFFHGRMEANEKKFVQEKFMNNGLDVMVATSAFGMGVDKDNVSLVVHYEISSSLENYVQEAGRAGRDKDLQAECVILFDQTDLDQHFNILQGARISQKEIQQIWRGIQQFKREKITKSALEIARKAGWDEDIRDLETRVKTAVNALEKAGYVERFLNSPQVFADSILIDNFEQGQEKIRQNAFQFQAKQEEVERVLKAIMGQSRRSGETRVDYLADSLGINGQKVVSIINQLKEIGVLGDLKDLVVDINLVKSKNGSLEIARRYLKLEKHVFQKFGEDAQKGNSFSVSLRELNDQISEDLSDTSMDGIRRILQIWELHGWIRKNRTNRSELVYQIIFKKEKQTFQEYVEQKKHLCLGIVKELILIAEREGSPSPDTHEGKVVSVEFSIILMKKKIETNGIFPNSFPLRFFERALLYLNHIGAIDLKRGFLVFFNRLNVGLKEQNVRKRYTLEDFQKMKAHYEKRIEQIHIAGEYAKRMLNNYQEALSFTSDYFELEYEEFLKKYFPKKAQRKEIRRAMTPEKFQELFSTLSLEQREPVRDSDSQEIVVVAGPGSGKTMVLVHKMANLILLEDIHPRQLLVLAFSRPAAREFKDRLIKLVGGIGRRVDIYTYHGYAFRLIGKMGNLQKAKNVIQEATKAILEGEIPLEMVATKNVIMLDEFQDVSQDEFDFLEAIREVAGDPRIIAAGDDDQNIYEFRGSSIQYMRQLAESEKAKTYFLTDNYRSGQHIVEFSNAFLDYFPQSRLKSTTLLKSRRVEAGAVKIIKYEQPQLIEEFCQSISDADLTGTVGILTATNDEAYFTASRLRNLGIPVTLVSSTEEFRLKNLLELQEFTAGLLKNINPESGRIPNETWNKVRSELKSQFEGSQDWPLVAHIINTFDQEKKFKYRVDWLEYLSHAKIEDFYKAEKGRVFVSTMHKIKGKQFDKVFLLLDNFSWEKDADIRVVYVAITRPRNYLEIHTHLSIFDYLDVPGLTEKLGIISQKSLPVFSIQCSLNDVVLSHFHKEDIKSRAQSLMAGDKLEFIPGSKFHRGMLIGSRNHMAVCFSTEFNKKLNGYFEKGYKVKSLAVGHMVYWWAKEEGAKVRVVLPEVELERLKI